MFNPLKYHLPPSLQDRSEKVAFLALTGAVSLSQVSIAASQILLTVAILSAVWIFARHRGPVLTCAPIILPLLAFSLWTIFAALASSNVALGLTVFKKFCLFLLLPLVPLVIRGEKRVTFIHHAIFAVALISAAAGLTQFIADPQRDLLHRISGFMSHWMTYSGLLMLVLVLLLAYTICVGWRNHKWVIPLGSFLILVLLLSQTRNAWIGATAGILVVVLLRRPRAVVGFFVVILVLYLASPASIKQRLKTSWDPEDPNTRNRIELIQTSMRLIWDNPWFGVGPKNVGQEALRYRGNNEFPDWMYQHMHNNFLQIAAERGIPGLLLWLWFMFRLVWDALHVYRSTINKSIPLAIGFRNEALTTSAGALGGWVALLFAGLFEYNFGDSEVLIMFLFIMSAPYAFLPVKSR